MATSKQASKGPNARQRAFLKLPRAKQRVVIAKDVLAQLAARKIVATQGTYFDPGEKRVLANVQPGQELSGIIQAIKCEACAVGSLFKCAVSRADGLVSGRDEYAYFELDRSSEAKVYKDINGRTGELSVDVWQYLGKYQFFTDAQLLTIEGAFEGDGMNQVDPCYPETMTAKQRMVAIMENIVRNNGTFKIEQERRKYGSING